MFHLREAPLLEQNLNLKMNALIKDFSKCLYEHSNKIILVYGQLEPHILDNRYMQGKGSADQISAMETSV